MRFRSSNYVFKRILNDTVDGTYTAATYKGVAIKSGYFLGMVLLGALAGILLLMFAPNVLMYALIPASICTFIFALIAMMSPRSSKVCGTIYCLAEGLLIGIISIAYNAVADGAIVAALLSTIAVFAVVTLLFTTNIVKVNSRFVRFLVVFAISFIVAQLLLFIIMAITGATYGLPLQLLLSGVATFLASLYLLFDLENIRRVVEGGYPSQVEWYASFGLVFTLVWLYVEILRIAVVLLGNRD